MHPARAKYCCTRITHACPTTEHREDGMVETADVQATPKIAMPGPPVCAGCGASLEDVRSTVKTSRAKRYENFGYRSRFESTNSGLLVIPSQRVMIRRGLRTARVSHRTFIYTASGEVGRSIGRLHDCHERNTIRQQQRARGLRNLLLRTSDRYRHLMGIGIVISSVSVSVSHRYRYWYLIGGNIGI